MFITVQTFFREEKGWKKKISYSIVLQNKTFETLNKDLNNFLDLISLYNSTSQTFY